MTQKPVIVCIEHDATMRNLLKIATMIFKVQFVEADSYLLGLEAIETHNPALVLLNPSIRGGDGWHLVSKVRTNPESAELPIIVISANSEVVEEIKGNPVDAVQAYFPKPFSVSDLKRTVKSYILPEIA